MEPRRLAAATRTEVSAFWENGGCTYCSDSAGSSKETSLWEAAVGLCVEGSAEKSRAAGSDLAPGKSSQGMIFFSSICPVT